MGCSIEAPAAAGSVSSSPQAAEKSESAATLSNTGSRGDIMDLQGVGS